MEDPGTKLVTFGGVDAEADTTGHRSENGYDATDGQIVLHVNDQQRSRIDDKKGARKVGNQSPVSALAKAPRQSHPDGLIDLVRLLARAQARADHAKVSRAIKGDRSST